MKDWKQISRTEYYQVVDECRCEGEEHILSLINAMIKGGDVDNIMQLPGNIDLLDEMFRKYNMTRWEKDLTYRVNPLCPNCEEEHIYYDIVISEDEQKQVEEFYRKNRKRSSLFMLLNHEFPLKVTRAFRCPICETEFEATVTILRETYLGRKEGVMRDDDIIQDW